MKVTPSTSLNLHCHLPPMSSSISESETTSSDVGERNDLLIVGPGILGRLVAHQWRLEYPECQVYGQTATTDHHGELVEIGIVPSVKGTRLPRQFSYVIFCAPPSRDMDYAADVRDAFSCWNGEGNFVFTSSSAPYDCADNGYCDEDTPVVPIGRSQRTDVLLKAENVVLEHGGCVLRLSGLYISLMDAASLAIVIMKKNLRKRIFLGCDNHPLSRQEIMDLVNQSGKFSKKFEAFTGVDGVLGKRLNNSKTREELGWQPKYPSFAHFLDTM
ncbi:hypothetical protein KSS87_011538 [Heliosperma pusillum]|nr:hypothetical protein KSS87_011538 [Heliosperma pusillum]